MIADKEAENFQLKLSVSRECVPVIIGQKGETIRTIKQTSGVLSIDIDRTTNQHVILRGRFVNFILYKNHFRFLF